MMRARLGLVLLLIFFFLVCYEKGNSLRMTKQQIKKKLSFRSYRSQVDCIDSSVERVNGLHIWSSLGKPISIFLLTVPFVLSPSISYAKEKFSADHYFSIIEKEADKEGTALNRLSEDIKERKWEDLKLFTRQFGEGFKAEVLKELTKELTGTQKSQAKELTDKFFNDVIQLNKASRAQNQEKAMDTFHDIEQDFNEFLSLRPGLE